MKYLFLLIAFYLPSSYSAQDCKKYILTTEYMSIANNAETVISNMRSSLLSSSNREFVQRIIKEKYDDDSYIVWVKGNKARFQKKGQDEIASIELILNNNEQVIVSPSIKDGYLSIDLIRNIAYSYPTLHKYMVSVSECEF